MVVHMTAGCFRRSVLTVVEFAILYMCVSGTTAAWDDVRGMETACMLQMSIMEGEGELGIYCILVYWNILTGLLEYTDWFTGIYCIQVYWN